MTTQPGGGLVQRTRTLLGLDFHVLMTLILRSWSVVAGAATILIIPAFLSPTEQGYYYTFAGILSLHIFFELGLNQVVVQLVAHEAAHLRISGNALEGDDARIDRLASLVQLLRRWYLAAALLFGVIGGIAGAAFFHQQGQLPIQEWLPVWVLLVLGTSLNLAFMPGLALLEGIGQIGQVARLRFAQSALGYAVLWLILFSGAKLWATVATPLIAAALSGAFLLRRENAYQRLKSRTYCSLNRIDWRKDVLPLQWRIAASWVSGYFIFYAFTPLVFAHQGSGEAGRFGMAMTMFNAISAVGMSWTNAKSPEFGAHISRGERKALNSLFRHVFVRSIVFTFFASAATVASVFVLSTVQPAVASRIADPVTIAFLGGVCVINCIVFSVATYMRAHREEPMLPVSVACGILTGLIAYFGSMHSVAVMTGAYLVMNLTVALPWSLHLFFGYLRRRS